MGLLGLLGLLESMVVVAPQGRPVRRGRLVLQDRRVGLLDQRGVLDPRVRLGKMVGKDRLDQLVRKVTPLLLQDQQELQGPQERQG